VPRDFIDGFLEWSELAPSPYLFRLWSAIACVAGALERRVWVRALARPTFPNLFVMLVAAPGIGKGIIDDVGDLWKRSKRLRIAPDSMTSASMLDALMEAHRVIRKDGAILHEYHSLCIPCEEFGFFLHQHDLEFLSRLNKIFVNPDEIRIKRKYLKEEVQILHPQLNILAGTQPGYLQSVLPEEAWTMGFTQRLLLIYASSGPSPELFVEEPEREARLAELDAALGDLTKCEGQLMWEPDAAERIRAWDQAGGPPAPEHSRLQHYRRRRTQYMLKLMMISAMSRRESNSPGGVITEFDFSRALAWLTAAESAMPDVFREMHQKSDHNLLNELSTELFRQYFANGRKPVHRASMLRFLAERAPGDKCHKLLELAEHTGLMTRVDDFFIPKKNPGEE
jgi:hypothetical protein